MHIRFNSILQYVFFFVINIFFFSVLSIYVYKIVCVDSYSITGFEQTLVYKETFVYYNAYMLSTLQETYVANFNFGFFFFFNNLFLHNNITIYNTFFFYYFLKYENIFFFSSDSFIQLYFFTKVNNSVPFFFFFCLQNYIIVYPGETSLTFFRVRNLNSFSFYGLSIYIIYPSKFSININKLQCFCFSKMYISSQETLDLPVLFFFDSYIKYIKKIFLFYLILLF